ncbi:MAG: SpaA isopeptide-forming pilin-related protein, partial [Clostridium sp.]
YDVLTTDENGKGVLLQVPYGIYRIKETKVPAGYDLNEAYQDVFVIGSEQAQRSVSLHVTNKQIKGKLALFKADADARDIGVAQARYGIYTKLITKADGTTEVDPDSYLGKEYDLITLPDIIIPEETDTKNGEQITQQRQQQPAVSKELPLGTYYIQELESPQGYQLNTEIYAKTLTADENYIEIFAEDDPIRASVTVHKTDAQSKKPLQGAVFAIYTKEDYEKLLHEGDQVQEIEAVYITTDEQGTAHADNLKLQEEYVLTEYKAPAGYEIDKNIEEHFTPDAGTLSFFYDFTNTKKAEIIIHKVNDEGYPLEGVLFGLYSFGPDQKAETADDVYIDTFSTGYDGTGIARYDTAALKNGWYYVREAKEPDMGYELSEEIKTFEITDQKREFTFTFVNHAAKGDVEIWKTDEMGNALQGAQFALYKAGDSWFTEEDIENNDVFVQDFVMDEGAHAIIKNLEVDCYVIKETKTPAGYKKADDIFFDLNHGEVQQENGRKQYYYRQEIRNVPIVGHIEVQKKIRSTIDRNADISLKNAVFHILDEQGSIADILVTDESGKATSRELAQGTYIVKEITAPLGSVLNTKPQRVTIDGSQSDDIYS